MNNNGTECPQCRHTVALRDRIKELEDVIDIFQADIHSTCPQAYVNGIICTDNCRDCIVAFYYAMMEYTQRGANNV